MRACRWPHNNRDRATAEVKRPNSALIPSLIAMAHSITGPAALRVSATLYDTD